MIDRQPNIFEFCGHPQRNVAEVPTPEPDADQRGWVCSEAWCAAIAEAACIDQDGLIDGAIVHDVVATLADRGYLVLAPAPVAAPQPAAADPAQLVITFPEMEAHHGH